MPGINPATFPSDAAHAAIDVETSSGDTVTHEPPLACYVNAACPVNGSPALASPRSAPSGCANPRRLVFAVHAARRARVTSVTAYLDGRRVKTMRGRHLTAIRLPPLPARAAHTIRLVVRSSDGRTRVTRHRYRGCAAAR
jgi:hypothetical protein